MTVPLPILLLLTLFSLSNTRPLVVTIATSDAEILPARVMLQSFSENADLPTADRLLLATDKVTHTWARPQLALDQAKYQTLPDPPMLHDGPAPRLSLFAPRPDYDIILFLSPHILVTNSLTSLLTCPGFCATFHSPCSFSSSIMAIIPNATLNAALLARAAAVKASDDHSCTPKNRPDWLNEEDCVLNAQLGKQLLTAPLLRGNVSIPTTPVPHPLRRLPGGWKVPHYLYYPRLRWEIPQESCSGIRTLDFSSPPLLRPWYWWTYPFLHLSWQWRQYRQNLPSYIAGPLPPSLLAFLRALFPLLFIGGVFLLALRRITASAAAFPVMRKYPENEWMLRVAAAAFFAGVCSWLCAFWTTPTTFTLEFGAIICALYRSGLLTAFWVLFGSGFIARQTAGQNSICDLRWANVRQATCRTALLCTMDTFLAFSLVAIAAVLPAQTMFSKIYVFVAALLLYCAGSAWLILFFAAIWRLPGPNLPTVGRKEFELDEKFRVEEENLLENEGREDRSTEALEMSSSYLR